MFALLLLSGPATTPPALTLYASPMPALFRAINNTFLTIYVTLARAKDKDCHIMVTFFGTLIQVDASCYIHDKGGAGALVSALGCQTGADGYTFGRRFS